MSRQLTTSRAARNRRLVAMSVWLGLIVTAMVMWNSRSQHVDINYPWEPIAFLLAAFTTFVSLFAWMLFNPARGVSAETTTLMLAGAATLFPPSIIAYCCMPPDSMLGGWLTAGLFVLLMIAVMSPVPEEFFGIPRDRLSYVQQVSMAGLSGQSVMELHPDWLQSTDLTGSVPDTPRPSLAPSSWQDEERVPTRTERRRRIAATRQKQKETPVEESAPSPERRGLFGRLKDRASAFRESSRSDDESIQVTPADDATRTEPSSGSEAPSAKRRRSQPDRSAQRSTLPPVPFDPPAPKARQSKPEQQERRRSIPLADMPPVIPVAPPDRSEDSSDAPPAVPDPFTEESSARDSQPDAGSSSSTVDELQVADHARQTQFERVTDELGGEMIEGTVTIRFSRGQKRANVHVPFSPPLAGRPEVECHAVDDDSIRVKVPECRAWGLRIEGRRSDVSTTQESEIAFSAVYVASR